MTLDILIENLFVIRILFVFANKTNQVFPYSTEDCDFPICRTNNLLVFYPCFNTLNLVINNSKL
ncbi:Uncharacterized protein APZ42_026691 [Daphnia magna]|uniref:Uncharacterized protein n=1 Tax=Daphnia magna TaxID=35525 RepID=A0A0P6B9I5_9CRUS|nr:Uncharacterized protein APZ42_026691 [Daphnia magna]